jgi:preprotein translocase subunit SecE
VTDFRQRTFPKKALLASIPERGSGDNGACRIFAADEILTMAKISPFKFLQEVRAETEKVTWPTRRETAITTAMVFVMVALASIFFLIADQVIRIAVTFVLGIGG